MVVKKLIARIVVMAFIAFALCTISYGAMFVDNCSSDEDTIEAEYKDFSSTSKVDELFGTSEGLSGTCLYAKTSAENPYVVYYFYGAENIVVDVVSADSNVISKNDNGDYALGVPNKSFKIQDSQVYVSPEKIAFARGKGLEYNNWYQFTQPYKSKVSCYLGANVYGIVGDGTVTIAKRKLLNIRKIPKSGGGTVYLERYSFDLPKGTYVVKVSLCGYTKLWNGNEYQQYIKKNPHGILNVKISGEDMKPSTQKILDDSESYADGKSSKGGSKGSSSGTYGLEVSVKSERSTSENVTVYDNDTVVQNIYKSGENKETEKEYSNELSIEDEPIPVGNKEEKFPQQETSWDDNVPYVEEDNNTWKFAGIIYIAIAAFMLLLALIAKKPNDKDE